MITQEEFRDLFMNDPNYPIAREALDKLGYEELSLSPYNTNANMLKVIVALKSQGADNQIKELAELMTIAHDTQTDIDIVIKSEERKKTKRNGLESFFAAFEDKKSPDRLFILVGETGVGKTYIATNRYPKATVLNCHEGIDAYSLMYSLEPNAQGQLIPTKTPFHNAVLEGHSTIMDEMNLLPHETQMLIQGLTDRKSHIVVGSEIVKIADGFRILATMNPPSETDERRPLGDALLGRAVSYVLELTDDIICQRLKVSKKWLSAIRNLYNHLRASGFIDVRNLDYRDYDKMSRYDFEEILKSKICQGDVSNIRNYATVIQTGEYEKLCDDVRNAQ
jgi:hypothetical protein